MEVRLRSTHEKDRNDASIMVERKVYSCLERCRRDRGWGEKTQVHAKGVRELLAGPLTIILKFYMWARRLDRHPSSTLVTPIAISVFQRVPELAGGGVEASRPQTPQGDKAGGMGATLNGYWQLDLLGRRMRRRSRKVARMARIVAELEAIRVSGEAPSRSGGAPLVSLGAGK